MIARYDLAPLEGITKQVYRRVWARRFGGADRCFIPFISPTPHHILTPREQRELENPENLPLVPQVMTRRGEDFVWAAEQLAQMGYREVNLNLGCPSGTVTAKGKGYHEICPLLHSGSGYCRIGVSFCAAVNFRL